VERCLFFSNYLVRKVQGILLDGIPGKPDQVWLSRYFMRGKKMAGARADAHRLETLHKRMGMEAFPGRKIF